MTTDEAKDRSGARSAQVLDFQSRRIDTMIRTEAALSGIPPGLFIELIRLAQRAEKIWRDEIPAVRREELGLLDIRDRSCVQVRSGSDNISLLDLDRDFVASRLASLAAKQDLQGRGAIELDAEATQTWDDIEATISCVKDWAMFVETVRAYERSLATET
ncbi:hypothetical protein L6654_30995 [Bradyrhizobium sp. WYCCWR 13023]|uniref:Uncharacterized protein n=1 Tax=Bradyrhizobium zhengyangense TaxID=2911009 RepID=A0A9X1UBF0_9BRAD|nr:hypothetical protein [Bradyrhizobium zhengyangense]MCG2631066.1 hypothetical protein [Bradyrhizobium zhengyangense]